jgi:hypothetical protein
MRLQQRHGRFLVTFALVSAAAGCGSSSDKLPDSAVSPDSLAVPADTRAAAPDGLSASDILVTSDSATIGADAATAKDTAVDSVAVGIDGPAEGIDGSKLALDGWDGWDGWDGAASEAGGGTIDTSPSRLDAGTGAADAVGQADAPSDVDAGPAEIADAGFVPGPATAALVNAGMAGQFSLADGTWKIFYFDAVAGQVYAVSGLSGITRGYVSTSPSVSPSNYQFVTNADGNLSFTAAAAQRYYIAAAVSGGGASGSFQVADGGTLVALGSTVVALTAPDGDNSYFYRFPITAGHGYTFAATGPSQPSVKIAVGPRAERSSNGQLSGSIWGVGGSLPFTGYDIPAVSVATSYSGFYFFYINVTTAMTITVTIAEAP